MFDAPEQKQVEYAESVAVVPQDARPLLIIDRVTGETVGTFACNVSVVDLSYFDSWERGVVQLLCQSGRGEDVGKMVDDSESWIQKGVIV